MNGALRILAAITLLVLLGMFSPFMERSALAQSGDATLQVLKVGTFPDNRPWAFRGENGELTGFDVDLIRAVAQRLNARVNFVALPFRDLLPALEDGRIDVAICSITVTPARRARFDFTQPYYETSQGIVVLKGSRIRSVADLTGKSVSTAPGTTNEQWLRENSERYHLGQILPVEGLEQGLELLTNRGADAYFGDLPALLYSLLKRPDLAVVQRLPTDDRYALALKLGSPLTGRVDDALGALKTDGTLLSIHRRWFGSAPPTGSPVTRVLPRP